MRIEQSWLALDNPRPRQPKDGNIVAGIHLHNPISSWGQWCQDAWVETAQFQPWNAMPHQYFWHLSGDMGSAREGFRCAFWFTANIFLNITNCEIQWPAMLIAQRIGQVSLVGCTNDWHNGHSSRKLILWIPPPIASVNLAVDLMTLRVSEAHWFKI